MRIVRTRILNPLAFRGIRFGTMLLGLAASALLAQTQFIGQFPPLQANIGSGYATTNPFGFRQPEIGSPPSLGSAILPTWGQTLHGPFQSDIHLNSMRSTSGMISSGTGFSGLDSYLAAGSNRLRPFPPAARNLKVPLLSAESPLHPLSSGSLFGPPTQRVPSLNELLHGSSSPRTSSPFGITRAPESSFLPRAGLNDPVQLPPASMFITSDLGNGVLFSAGTGGGHSMVGAPAAGLSSSTGPKRTNAAVNLKLSF